MVYFHNGCFRLLARRVKISVQLFIQAVFGVIRGARDACVHRTWVHAPDFIYEAFFLKELHTSRPQNAF